MDNLQDKITYKPGFQRQKMVSPYLTATLPNKQISITTQLSNMKCKSNGPYLTSSEMSGSRINSYLSFAKI